MNLAKILNCLKEKEYPSLWLLMILSLQPCIQTMLFNVCRRTGIHGYPVTFFKQPFLYYNTSKVTKNILQKTITVPDVVNLVKKTRY
jgi:hypothetical protein